jgi:uncharacterized lipoprotein YehR (DUF1307 family)
MKVKMKMMSLLSTSILFIALAGCGTTADTSENEENNSGSGNEDAGIVAGKIVPSLKEEAENQYVFVLKNDKAEDVTLTMNSSQYFDYQLIDSAGTVAYTYSADKLFTQMLEEKVLKPGEILEMKFDVTEGLANLQPGTYKLAVWSTAEEMADQKVTTEITWDGPVSEDTGSTEGKLNVMEQSVTYVGLQDLNSIEVKNEQNEAEAMRLSEVAKPFFEELEEGAKITVFYVLKDGQKIIQTATRE